MAGLGGLIGFSNVLKRRNVSNAGTEIPKYKRRRLVRYWLGN